jgi:hypothetical protein
MICWGCVLVVAQIKPFWVDEWRVIYNLKYKSPALLFGQLDYMQQFPRVYLTLIKLFSAQFDYSYFTLRLPSFLVGSMTIFFTYRLMKKLFPGSNMNKFLFVMILVSSYTFTEYFVQVKQYTMDILLSVAAMFQLIELLKLATGNVNKSRYLLLCLSLLVFPFFSYTYPIAIAPAYVIIFWQNALLIKNRPSALVKQNILRQWLALGICTVSIFVFYVVDAAQLMQDKGMQQFWQHIIMNSGFSWNKFYANFYQLFASAGSGALYSLLFGVLGIISFAYGIYRCAGRLPDENDLPGYMIRYGACLLTLVLLLFIIGKFPLGETRLSAFTVPSIAILIVSFLDHLRSNTSSARYAKVIASVLYIGVIGNIYTTFYTSVSDPEYTRALEIYEATENAIILAQEKKVPILITSGVAYPYENTKNLPFNTTLPGDWILKTFPAYKVNENIPVYGLKTLKDVKRYMQQLPSSITQVMAGDGISYHMVSR